MKLVVVKDSKIQGKGIFAGESIKKGEVILSWNTEKILSKKDLEKVNEEDKKYVSKINSSKYAIIGKPARYMNHSCNANTVAKDRKDIAKRAIKQGEEITANYFEEGSWNIGIKCNCGSKNCKGII